MRAASWDAVSAAIEEAYRAEGYAVTRASGNGADFEVARAGRSTLVACKRWKVARTGIEPLRELHAAALAREVPDCVYIAAGEVSANALAFAAEKRIRLLHGAELAKMMLQTSLLRGR
ncbi:MAG: restriction endonuclease [Burkholderiales bacterium]